MAVATLTSSVFANNPPRDLHSGLQAVYGSINTATRTIGDIIFLAKLPNGAQVLEILESHSTAETSLGISFGLAKGTETGGGASHSAFMANSDANVVNRYAKVEIPIKVSLSASDITGYGIFCAKIGAGTATTSFQINFTVTYMMP